MPEPNRSPTLVRATAPLRRRLGVEWAGAAVAGPLDGWYATAVRLEGGHAVLFAEARSLLEVVVPAGPRAKVERAFARRAVALLARLELPPEVIDLRAARLERVLWTAARADGGPARRRLAATLAGARRLAAEVGALAPGFGATSTAFELSEAERSRATLGGRTPRSLLVEQEPP